MKTIPHPFIQKDVSANRLAYFAFFLYFPGYFFYHAFVRLGVIVPVLGGYINQVTALTLVLLLPPYCRKLLRGEIRLTTVEKVFWAFLAYFTAVVAANFMFPASANEEVVLTHIASIIQLCTILLMFRLCDFSTPRAVRASLITMVVLSLFTFWVLIDSDGLFFMTQDADNLATYQAFAQSYFFAFIVLVPFLRSRAVRSVFYLISLPAFFFIGARSQLVVCIISSFLLEVYYSKRPFVVLMWFVAAGAAIAAFSDQLEDLLPESRMFGLLAMSADDSVIERQQQIAFAVRSITEHPFWGDYGSYAILGGRGNYAHNILSAWVDVGIIGFLLLVIVLLFAAAEVIRGMYREGRRAHFTMLAFSFCYLSFVVILLLTAKTFTDLGVAAAVGSIAAYVDQVCNRYTPAQRSPAADAWLLAPVHNHDGA